MRQETGNVTEKKESTEVRGGLKFALDVGYDDDTARAACVVFERWSDPEPLASFSLEMPVPSAYVPGSLYLRELPPLLAVVEKAAKEGGYRPEFIMIDGYVWLTARRLPGLGLHLYQQMQGKAKVIGVAKNPYQDTPAPTLFRAGSKRPLYITSAGVHDQMAVAFVASMHGAHRIPDMLRLADSISKGRMEPAADIAHPGQSPGREGSQTP